MLRALAGYNDCVQNMSNAIVQTKASMIDENVPTEKEDIKFHIEKWTNAFNESPYQPLLTHADPDLIGRIQDHAAARLMNPNEEQHDIRGTYDRLQAEVCFCSGQYQLAKIHARNALSKFSDRASSETKSMLEGILLCPEDDEVPNLLAEKRGAGCIKSSDSSFGSIFQPVQQPPQTMQNTSEREPKEAASRTQLSP